jgi:hypothetical protein
MFKTLPLIHTLPQTGFSGSTIFPNNYQNSLLAYEFEIPNNSMFNFVGVDSKRNTAPNSPLNDLGSIVISFNSFIESNTDPRPQSSVDIQMFAALTDEGRYGFQVYCPPFDFYAVDTVGGVTYAGSAYTSSGTASGASQISPIVRTELYYTRSV